MNWLYALAGVAALVIFVYLLVALFQPDRFE
jgi:K+-transporting ATPase KdpF subunit